jgi:enterochelin esterase-like enzyme
MNRKSGLTILIPALVFIGTMATAAAPIGTSERYSRVVVHGASLVGNLAGDPPDRQVSVYLPPGYSREPGRRYPVLYLLHGFTDSDANWFGLEGRKHFVNVPKAVDRAFAAGVREMIVVMPDAYTRFQGSMYSNSALNGDWETFISRDLVRYVDAHYRTLARPEGRGLAGHSMGGYGTLRVAMKAPGVFSALYVMSPCCLAPGSPPPDAQALARAAAVRTPDEIAAADFFTKAMLASAAAWSPDPKNPPLFISLPIGDSDKVAEVLADWTANGPVFMVHQYLPALKSYRAIALDSGDQDPVPARIQRLHELLDNYGIRHSIDIYPGDHVNRIDERLSSKVLPFFAEQLAADKK